MAALITFDDLASRPGFEGGDREQAERVIEDDRALVADIARPVELDPAALPPAIVPVIVSMVRRGLHNPHERTSEQLGDYGWQAGGQAAAGIYATRREVRIIRRAVGRLGAGTATLSCDLPLPSDSLLAL